MKLYRFTVGLDEKFYPFNDEKEAYDQRTTVDPSYNWLPVVIEEIKVDGFEIEVKAASNDPFEGWDKQKLRQFLDEKGIQYVPQWGEQKLRELALGYV